MSETKKSATRTASGGRGSTAFTDEEKAAMRETARERKAQAGRTKRDEREEGERDIQAKIAEMPEADRVMAERIHALVTANAPELVPRTWYGMPAYAKDGKVICFFTAAAKFKSRYASFGFNDDAMLDEGTMWPTAWALTRLTPADEAQIAALVRKAVR
jgi:uncharacterized protein YdhG (YjbR/CyaY superfamily)